MPTPSKNTPQLCAITLFLLISVFLATASDVAAYGNSTEQGLSPIPTQTPPPAPEFTIAPATVQQGKEYEVLLTSNRCVEELAQNPARKPEALINRLKEVDLYAPQGSGITLKSIEKFDCNITAKISVAPDATAQAVKLWLKNTSPMRSIELIVTEVTPGPIPPGLGGKGQVDVMWSVLPENIVHDNFGKKVSQEYYCIEVVVGNDSGYDLQISSVGFKIPELNKDRPDNSAYIVPSVGFRMARGTLERAQQVGWRNKMLAYITSIGPLLTGFTPFFHALNHRANFSEGVNIFSNPFEKGYEQVFPDTTIRQLDRLADQVWRDDNAARTIVQNNTQLRLMTFFPAKFLFPPVSKTGKTRSFARGYAGVADQRREEEIYNERKDPQAVMRRLGQIVLIGDIIQHTNRIRVVSNQLLPNTTDFPISGRVTDDCGLGVSGVTVTLSGDSGFTARSATTDSAGDYTFANVPAGRRYTLKASLTNAVFNVESGNEAFVLNDARQNVNFKATLNPFTITGRITKDGAALKDITVELKSGETIIKTATTDSTGAYKFEVKDKPVTGSFIITPTTNGFTYTPKTQSWNCNRRDTDFSAKQP